MGRITCAYFVHGLDDNHHIIAQNVIRIWHTNGSGTVLLENNVTPIGQPVDRAFKIPVGCSFNSFMRRVYPLLLKGRISGEPDGAINSLVNAIFDELEGLCEVQGVTRIIVHPLSKTHT